MELQPIINRKPKAINRIFNGIMLSASALALAAFIVPKDFYTPVNENELIKNLRKKTEAYTKYFSEERVYVQFDKPMYEPGENIWFAAYVRDGLTMKQTKISDVLHVELINPKGSVEKIIKLIAHNGKAAGDFTLDAEAPGGMYKIRAYTNWMKNSGEENVFEKEFQVQDVVLPNLKMKLDFERKAFGAGDEVIAKLELNTNENKALSNYKINFVCNIDGQKILEKADVTDEEGIKYIRFNLPEKLNSNDGLLNVMISYNGNTESVSRSIPIVLNKIGLNFFPEGGDLVNGLESNVAFKATNEFGKPADIEGIVVTEKGSTVASFSSFYMGMGAFKLIPQDNEKYFVKITRPEGISEKYELPAALDKGYILNIDNSRDGELSANINCSESEELSIIAQVRGKIYYANAVQALKGSGKIVFPTKDFPAGVAQITLFDSKGVARCERLAFVNKDRRLDISITPEKEKYLPREKVKLNITVKDEKGFPVPANLSMSVVNDQFLSFADDKSGNMLSQLLLQQDIKEKVEEPAFYFDRKEEKADKALDYLLMTAGWRQFTWEKITSENFPYLSHTAEKAIFSGMIYDSYNSKPVSFAQIKTSKGQIFKADTNGRFIVKNIDLYEPLTLTYSAQGYQQQSQYLNEYNQGLNIYLYNPSHYKQVYNNYPRANNAGWGAGGNNVAGIDEEMQLNEVQLIAVQNVKVQAAPQNEIKAVHPKKNARKERDNVKKEEAGKAVVADNKNAEEKKGKKNHNGNKGVALNGKIGLLADDLKQDNFNADELDQNRNQNGTVYYRARKFAAPVYDKEEKVEVRTDFRNTVYWNPEIEIGKNGKKTVEFYTSDDITSLRATVEGAGTDGSIGRSEKTFFTQLPFAMSTKIPVEVATEDIISIPLTLKNNTDGPLGGVLSITAPDGLKELVKVPEVQTIMPGKAKTIYLDYKVLDKIGYGDFTISFKSCGLGDAFTQKIKIASKGFPVTHSFSAQEKEKEFSFGISDLVNGSLKATVTAYPNVVSDLMKGIEGILREPYGCFEQTSMSSYPNAMVLDYLKATDSKDEKLIISATGLLDRGYKKLTTFETKENGYEWFGSNPGHEALTAYGLMQFADMKRVGEKVDNDMLDRTAKWLMDKKNGKGGFRRNDRALDYFGRASEAVTNAYIVYSLSEAGYTDIKKEFAASYDDAGKGGDAYVIALVANAAYNLKETTKGDNLVGLLLKKQIKDGSFEGANHSITYSQGQSLTIETSSLAIMALLKSQGKNPDALMNGVKWLVASRNGYGAFGNTQGTILALKALTEFAKFSRKTNEDGNIVVYIDGKKAAEKYYKAGEKNAIVIDDIESKIYGEGKHDIKVKFEGVKNALPYSVAVSYNTTLPASNKECAVDIKTQLFSKAVNVGETVRMTATVTNKKAEGIPSTMVIVGIPAGFTVQPWQLKEMQEKKVFDYYEINGNSIAIYYRCMAPSDKKEINLDLKAEMPGEYDAPASSAYLYYTNELKTWAGLEKITIKKNNG